MIIECEKYPPTLTGEQIISNQHHHEQPFETASSPPDPPQNAPELKSENTTDPPMSPKPENYIFVSRSESEGSIAGAWILDPRIPDSSAPMRVIVNPDMSYNTARVDRSAGEHLELVTANAPITCDLTLTAHNPRSLDSGRRKVTLFLQTTGKLCKLRVRAPDVKQRAPLNIILHTSNATASLYIPRSFRGIVSVAAACACIRMSKAVERSAQPFGFTAGSTRYFVGDPSACRLEDMQTESKGDEAHISAPNGVVWIRYEDEQPSLFARLLALS